MESGVAVLVEERGRSKGGEDGDEEEMENMWSKAAVVGGCMKLEELVLLWIGRRVLAQWDGEEQVREQAVEELRAVAEQCMVCRSLNC